MRVAIVTVSDSSFDSERRDESGETIREWCSQRGYTVTSYEQVPDETSRIVPRLVNLCDDGAVDLVLTTGGTGLASRDVTPEATRVVLEREADGIAEYLRAATWGGFPRAALSRGVAGVRGRTLVINLPGSPRGVSDTLGVLERIVEHAVDVMTGVVTRHDRGPAA